MKISDWLRPFRCPRHGAERRRGLSSSGLQFPVAGAVERLERRLALTLDWGDAPDAEPGAGPHNYQTSLADNGPNHVIVAGLMLGSRVDGEADAVPDAQASGDDTQGLIRDEDGLSNPFDLSVTIGSRPTIALRASNPTGTDAIVWGWIDYNGDGVFDNDHERASGIVPAGTDNGLFVLTFPRVPAFAATGTSFARFRLSTDSAAASPIGPAQDGEVEDYAVEIVRPASTTLNERLTQEVLTADFTAMTGQTLPFYFSVMAGDIDGDGISDRARLLPNSRGMVSLEFLNPDGSVRQQKAIRRGTGVVPDMPEYDLSSSSVAAVGDIDGDSVPDLVVGRTYDDTNGRNRGALLTLLLDRTGSVTGFQKIASGVNGGPPLLNQSRFGTRMVGMGDIDGDGISELAVSSGLQGSRRQWILFFNNSGTVRKYTEISEEPGSLAAPGDLNADEIPDLLSYVFTYSSTNPIYNSPLRILYMNPDGTVKYGQAVLNESGEEPSLLRNNLQSLIPTVINDVNGDGVREIAFYTSFTFTHPAVVTLLSLMPQFDLGDAPDQQQADGSGNYATALADNGPRHYLVPDLFLGEGVDDELDSPGGTTIPGAGDDLTGLDDEDGVAVHADLILVPGQAPQVRLVVTNTTGLDAQLYGWIDFNGDGEFDTLTERATASVPDGLSGDTVILTFPAVPTGFHGRTFARFRLSSDPAAALATGDAWDGEVEDWPVLILNTTDRDAGDAPDSSSGSARGNYQTHPEDGGPVHGVIPELRLGALVNGNAQITTSSQANGDADEDGLVDPFTDLILTVGTIPRVTLRVTNLTGNSARLSGWIDFNQNGVFESETEGTSLTIVSGTDHALRTLVFPAVPLTAATGQTSARFRLSTDPAADSPVGSALNGEVEDYAVQILSAADATVATGEVLRITAGTATPPFFNPHSFGNAVAIIGDLDGDGVKDLAVGIPGDDSGGVDQGAVQILFMNADGSVRSRSSINGGTVNGPVLRRVDRFGSAVAAIGDLDGDGLSELAVGAPGDDLAAVDAGAVWIIYPAADGSVKAATKITGGRNGAPVLQAGDAFGISLAALADLNGDGRAELVVGASGTNLSGPDRGAAYVLFLGANGTVQSHTTIGSATGGGPILKNGALLGTALTSPGDLNGDGIGDLAVGAPGQGTGGSIYTLLMNADGTAKNSRMISSTSAGGPALASNDAFGNALSLTGDLNGDGTVDLLVGAPGDDLDGTDRGALYSVLLNPNGTLRQVQRMNGLPDRNNEDRFGSSVAGPLDLNGDGLVELVAGAPGDDGNGAGAGAVYVLPLNSRIDTGDAPDNGTGTGPGNYQTLLISNGPQHVIVPELILGNLVDGDSDGTPSSSAQGDNLAGGNDEDGLLNPGDELLLTPGVLPTLSIQVTNRTGRVATLAGWIDYNRDGVFDNDAERSTLSIPSGTVASVVTLSLPVVPINAIGVTYARFRLSTDVAALEPFGPATDGEVEDYQVFIRNLTSPDFGDAPDSGVGTGTGNYRTLSIDQGPSHQIVPNLRLGASVDGELDASADALARGDGLHDPFPDDEDGLPFGLQDLQIVPGTVPQVSVTVTNLTGAPAALFAWVDYNRDGVFDNQSEQASIPVPSGSDNSLLVLTFPQVPFDLSPGRTFARFRLSTDPAAAQPTGPAFDGEVEDHEAFITSLTPGLFAPDRFRAFGSGTIPELTLQTGNASGNDPDQFGTALASIGDLDGDGIPEIAASAIGDNTGGTDAGAVWILFLDAGQSLRKAVRIADRTNGGPEISLDDAFGAALTRLGDLDGDGLDELVVSATGADITGTDQGVLHVLFLKPDGTVRQSTRITSNSIPAPAVQSGLKFGQTLTSPGDLDGDGIGDLVAGTSTRQIVTLFLNRDGTVRESKASTLASLITSLTTVGDVNGDGIPDLATGPSLRVHTLRRDGTIDAGQLVQIRTTSSFMPRMDVNVTSVVGPGDLDGDGIPDLMTGSSGRVRTILLAPDLTVKAMFSAGNPSLINFPGPGRAIALLSDLNGDGAAEFVTSAPSPAAFQGSDTGLVYLMSLQPVSGVFTRVDDLGYQHLIDLTGDTDNNLSIADGKIYSTGNDLTDGYSAPSAELISAGVSSSLNVELRGGNDRFTLADRSYATVSGGSGNDTIASSAGYDQIDGGAGDDSLSSGNSPDTLLGGSGRDTLDGGDDNDIMDGGDDADVLRGGSGVDTILMTADFNITVTADELILSRLNGRVVLVEQLDSVEVASILGGPSRNRIDLSAFTTAVRTTIIGGGGSDTIIGSPGHDRITTYSSGRDSIMGMDGDDTIASGNGDDTIDGGPGKDSILGQDGNDFILGGPGNDALHGGAGDDSLEGQGQDDKLFGLTGNDLLRGGDGNDSLFGDAGDDTLAGMQDADLLRGGPGQDDMDGGAGSDRVDEFANSHVIVIGVRIISPVLGDEIPRRIERIALTGGDSGNRFDAHLATVPVQLNGGNGDDTLLGGLMDDTVRGQTGNDIVSGGSGHDVIEGDSFRSLNELDTWFESADSDFVVIAQGGSRAGDVRVSSQATGDEIAFGIERLALKGGPGDNALNAAAASVPVILLGAGGDDSLTGGSGSDVLTGGFRSADSIPDGSDSLDGRGGSDLLLNELLDTLISDAGDTIVSDVFASLPVWLDFL